MGKGGGSTLAVAEFRGEWAREFVDELEGFREELRDIILNYTLHSGER